MYKKFKKAFTLVELVVVITIVAILSGVAVISYVGLTDNARNSKDQAIVNDLNNVLLVSSVSEKNNTFSDIIPDLDDSGYDIEKLKPANTKHSFAWDSSNDKIVIINDSFDVVTPSNYKTSSKLNLFVICHSEEDITKYKGLSYYLASDYSAPEDLSMTHLAGIDVGIHTINKLSITDESTSGTILINTTSGIVDINTPNATVNHYGVADDVNIKAVANQSYHLYGRINKSITIDKGRINVTNEGSTPSIVVNGNNIKIDTENGSSIGAIGVTKEEYKTSTEITQGNTRVNVEIEDAFNENTQYFSGGDGSESFPYLISSAEEFLKLRTIAKYNSKSDVYLLNNYYHYKLINDIDFSEITYTGFWFMYQFQGHIDGCNNKLIASKNRWSQLFGYNTGTLILENMTLVQNQDFSVLLLTSGGTSATTKNVIFRNINVVTDTPDITLSYAHNASAFLYYTNKADVSFINCTNNSNITFTGNCYGGVFVGGYLAIDKNFTFVNCVNNGTVSGNDVGFFNGNTAQVGDKTNIVSKSDFSDKKTGYANIYLENNINNGTLKGVITATPLSNLSSLGNYEDNQLLLNQSTNRFVPGSIITTQINGLSLQLSDNKLSLVSPDIESINYYQVSTYVSVGVFDQSDNSLGSSYVRITTKIPQTAKTTTKLDYYSKMIISSEYQTPYEEIESEEKEADDKNKNTVIKYKTVTDNGENLIIVNEATALAFIKLTFKDAHHLTLSPKSSYMFTAFDSAANPLGSITYRNGALES